MKVKCLAHQSVILARRLIRCLATDLGAEPLEFLKHHSGMFTGRGNNATAIRLLHYPKIDPIQTQEGASCPSSELNCITRCGEHTDYGGLTLLYQVHNIKDDILEFKIYNSIEDNIQISFDSFVL